MNPTRRRIWKEDDVSSVEDFAPMKLREIELIKYLIRLSSLGFSLFINRIVTS